MVSIGVKTDCITFTSILSGCSHSGLVSDGRSIFESMGKVHGTIMHVWLTSWGVLEPLKKLSSS
ncbi:hypothetical protein SEVIR_8G099801v4 [Setaria viridis]